MTERSDNIKSFPLKQIIAVLGFFLLLQPSTVFSQEYPIRSFGEGELPKVGVAKGILQDHTGVIWMWGSRGITYYDGTRFSHFSQRRGLPSDYVYTAKLTESGDLFFSTYGGLLQYLPERRQFKTVVAHPKSPIRDVVFHERGMFCAFDGGVLFHDERGSFPIAVMWRDSTKAENFMVHRVEYDPENELLWAATDRYGIVRTEVDKLWPLFELKEGVKTSPDDIHICPVAFAEYPRMVSDDISIYKIDNPRERLRMWQEASEILNDGFVLDIRVTDGMILDPETHEPIAWEKQSAFRITTEGRFHKISFPEESTVLRDVSLTTSKKISICRGRNVYFLDGLEAKLLDRGEGMLDREIFAHYQDSQDIHWLLDSQGDLHRFATADIRIYSSDRYPSLHNLHHVVERPNGDLLLASSKAISCLRQGEIVDLCDISYLEGEYVNFGIDKFEQFVIATSNRIYLHNQKTGITRPLTGPLSINSSVTNFDTDVDGNLWFILSRNIYRWDGYNLVRHEADTFTSSLFIDVEPDGGIFVGQWPWILEYRYGKKRYITELDIGEYAPEHIPCKTRGIEIGNITLPDDYFLDGVSATCASRGLDGAYWVGTFGAGMFRLDSYEDLQQTYDSLRIYDTRNGLPSNSVIGLHRDNKGNLFFTLGEGAAMVGQNGLENIDLKLPPLAVLSDYFRDDNGRLVCATTKGLLVVDGNRQYTFDRSSGIPEDEVSKLMVLKDNRILALQPNGIYLLTLDKLLESVIPGFQPIVSSVEVDTELYGTVDHVDVDTDRRALQCQVSLPDFFNEDSHLFSWRLIGFDTNYRPFTRQTQIEYTNLPPGTYQLAVRARNGIGEERDLSKPLTVHVPKRFYETYGFYILVLVAAFLIVFLFFRWRIEQFRAKQEQELQFEQEKLRVANRLAASIAHEFNNPLQIILGAYELVRENKIASDRKESYLDRIPFQVSRMQKLIEKLLRIREIREVDYAAGVKILDIHPLEEEDDSFDGEMPPFDLSDPPSRSQG